MEAVWELGEPTVAQVCRRLGADANYKTVMTVMNRLVDKGALGRRRVSRAYAYRAAESRSALAGRVTRRVAEGLVEEFGALAVAQFVDALDAVDPDLVDGLRRVLRQHAEDGGA